MAIVIVYDLVVRKMQNNKKIKTEYSLINFFLRVNEGSQIPFESKHSIV